MQGEARNFILVWLVAVPAALAYCRALPSFTKPGKRRLLALLPVVVLFFLLPLSLSSVHLRFFTACFLCWVAVFRLLLFVFDRGPLCDCTSGSRLPFTGFIALACLPIVIKRESSPKNPKGQRLLTIIAFAIKGLLLAMVISIYPKRSRLRREVVLVLYSVHMYLEVDAIFAVITILARAMLPSGTDLEPQFAAPYLSSSLQEFWGRRWNILVSSLLREAVYRPVGAVYGPAAGMMASFLVSGLMHEILWIYLTLLRPTGEVTMFFVFHGICTVAEAIVKKWWSRRGWPATPTGLTAPLTLGFVMVSSWWLFLPQLERSRAQEQVVNELEAFFMLLTAGSK